MRVTWTALVVLGLALWALALEPGPPYNYVNTARIDFAALERDLLTEINRLRAGRGLPACAASPRLYDYTKNHSRRMALQQKLTPVDLTPLTEARAGSDPIAFWEGLRARVASVPDLGALGRVAAGWAQDPEAASDLLSGHCNQIAAGINADRAGVFYVAVVMAAAVPQEDDMARLEQAVLTAVNDLRARRGLRPLQASQGLAGVAREHSRNMAVGYFFGHTDGRGLDVVGRLRANGFSRWQACAENIACNQGQRDPAQTAVAGWLASPPHAAALLQGDFTHTGVGVARALDETYYFTQVFIK